MKPRRATCLLAASIVVAILVVYLPSLRNGTIWDDDYYVTKNMNLRSLEGLGRIWFHLGAVPQYYPLTHTTFWIEYHLWGLTPFGYHLDNVLLHACCALLWWWLLRRLGLGEPAAFLAAAVFALHPIEVESVAWITERKNVLSGALYLAAALAYLQFDDHHRPRWYFAALALFTGAMLSKTVVATLPAALLLVVYLRRGRITRRDVTPTLPFFVVSAALGSLTVLMERITVGATGEAWALTPIDRVLIAGRALWFYVTKLLWPHNLTFIYPRWTIDATQVWQYLFPAAALGVMIGLWAARRKLGRGPLVGVLYFAGTLFPALGFFNVFPMRYSFVADHFQYLAGMGIIAIVLGTLSRWRAGVVATCIALAVMMPLTWRQTYMYKDLATLWRTTLDRNDSAWMAHNNYGIVLDERGEHEQAAQQFQRAVELKPDHAQAWRQWGQALMALGRKEQGLAKVRRAYELQPTNTIIVSSLGQMLLKCGQYDEAEKILHKALDMHPSDPDLLGATLVDLGLVKMQQGQYADAVEPLEKAIAVRPDDAAAHRALAIVYEKLHRDEAAEAQYRQAMRLEPNAAPTHNNLAMLLARHGRLDLAESQLREAVRLDPQYAVAHGNLGVVLLARGDAAGAVKAFETALAIDPDMPNTLRSCAWVLATSPDDAVRNGSRAVQLAEHATKLTDDDPVTIDTLGAAYAEAGRFDDAIHAAKRAKQLAEQDGRSALMDAIGNRLTLYRTGKAYHESR